eukprot:14916647-Alexandrium_andersonii.AAC.1
MIDERLYPPRGGPGDALSARGAGGVASHSAAEGNRGVARARAARQCTRPERGRKPRWAAATACQ